jgi:hypothetical protein
MDLHGRTPTCDGVGVFFLIIVSLTGEFNLLLLRFHQRAVRRCDTWTGTLSQDYIAVPAGVLLSPTAPYSLLKAAPRKCFF